MDTLTHAGRSRVRRWPLAVIGLPAAVAIWSGWVGLGTMCGFGLVQPFPGIVGWHLDTAITLPIGVEAYGAYALGAWLTPGTPEQARTFARRSAIGALALGMLGQVVYHLLAAAHAARAPWPVVVLVSCLPVITLGFGAALTHLLRDDEDHADDETTHETSAEAPAVESVEPTQEPALVAVAGDAETAALAAMRATHAASNGLSQNQLMQRFGLTRATAKQVRETVLSEAAEHNGEPPNEAQRRVRAWEDKHQPKTDDGQGDEAADDPRGTARVLIS